MPRTNPIRWRQSDEKTLAYAVRAFNAKRTRLIKQVPELEDYLPAKRIVGDLKAQIATRNDYNKTIASLKRFIKKDAADTVYLKNGVKTTKYELREIAIRKRAINLKRKNRRQKITNPTEKGLMGTLQENSLRPKTTKPENVKKADWEDFLDILERQYLDSGEQGRVFQYNVNYRQAILNNLPMEYWGRILELVDRITPQDLYDIFYDDANLQIDFFYYGSDAEFKAQSIILILKEYLGLELSDEETAWKNTERFSDMYE